MMSGFFRLLTFLVLALLARLVISSWFRPKRRVASSSPAPQPVVGSMLKDPQCGTYVAAELAISAHRGGQTLHFCSEKCRKLYLASHQ